MVIIRSSIAAAAALLIPTAAAEHSLCTYYRSIAREGERLQQQFGRKLLH